MRLDPEQLDRGAEAVALFLTPSYPTLTPYQQHELRRRALLWVSPCLLGLPDGLHEVPDHAYGDLFRLAGEQFMVASLRRDERNDDVSDEDLRRRATDDDVARSALYLRELTSLFLIVASSTPPAAPLPTLEEIGQRYVPEALDTDLHSLLDNIDSSPHD